MGSGGWMDGWREGGNGRLANPLLAPVCASQLKKAPQNAANKGKTLDARRRKETETNDFLGLSRCRRKSRFAPPAPSPGTRERGRYRLSCLCTAPAPLSSGILHAVKLDRNGTRARRASQFAAGSAGLLLLRAVVGRRHGSRQVQPQLHTRSDK